MVDRFRVYDEPSINGVSIIDKVKLSTVRLKELIAGTGVALSDSGHAITITNVSAASPNIVTTNNAGVVLINGLGDSVTGAQSIYQPVDVTNPGIQSWQISTAYGLSEVVQNGGYAFFVSVAGTSASSGTGPTPASLTDGTVTWVQQKVTVAKNGTGYLNQVELIMGGRVKWDMSTAYSGQNAGLVKANVLVPGTGYKNTDALNLFNGAKATLNVDDNGGITGINLISPGRATGYFNYTITTSTGSGAILSMVGDAGGTFGISGCLSFDMVAALPDVVASVNDIIVVEGPFNDLTANTAYTTIIANLKTCYETLISAGKKVIATTITPRTGLTATQEMVRKRVNRWIRSYCQKGLVNTLGINSIGLADPSGYFTDGASATDQPIGGTGGSAGAMTQDGLHPSQRGAFYYAWTICEVLKHWVGDIPNYPSRPYTPFDPYDAIKNPGGNMWEALLWVASTAYIAGDRVQNGVNTYYCITGGTSASSGGPTGTGASITDNTVTWGFSFVAGQSVSNSGTTGSQVATTGIVYSGSSPTGSQIARSSGTAAGTVASSIESPWSNSQNGQRWVTNWSLGSGTAVELWQINFVNPIYQKFGLLPADLNNTLVYAVMEVELSGIANVTKVLLQCNTGVTVGFDKTGAGEHLPNSTGEMVAFPTKFLLTTQPTILPLNTTVMNYQLLLGFDASGAASSSTLTLKVNYMGFYKYGVI
jgi:hypothetical protein